jgi:site-specific DNA-cytosine methylase
MPASDRPRPVPPFRRPAVLDLFCGACGGWSLGLHRAGFATVAACEIDPWRRNRFARNFPEARLYDDVRELTAARLRADGVFPALIVGSPPCQDASTANAAGRGVDGERTGLFFEAVRLVAECRPRWAAFENVPGIRRRGIDRVLGALEEAGYACWPLVVGALDLGAPHPRKRGWFVAADAATVQRLAQPWGEPDRGALRAEAGLIALDAGDADGARLAQREGERGDAREERPPALRAIGEAWHRWNGGAARFGRMDDGLPKGMARPALAAFGDAVMPQIPEIIGRAILAAEPVTTRER